MKNDGNSSTKKSWPSALARASAQIDAIWWGVTGPRGLTARGFWWVIAGDNRPLSPGDRLPICSEEIQMRYRDAIRFLEKVAA
ncbi:hypothetical protein [Escherichia coli]|uniref:hypothetical protein n=1 Tax=Escherichia coli TaxID=562 RepID=UPI002FCCE7C5